MSNFKLSVAGIAVIAAVVLGIVVSSVFLHSNNVQNFQVIQSVNGAIEIRSDGGYYFRAFPRIWTYPKVNTVFFSNETKESKDRDGVQVRFSNKGEGDVSCQVVYRLYTDQESIKRMHTYSGGNIDVIDNLILSKLKDIAMTCASNITSSQAIEDREEFATNIRKFFVNNKELKEAGIVNIQGSDSDDCKAARMVGFATGKVAEIVTKPKIAGFGMNWQRCSKVIFLGLSDSYEQFYQAVRRFYRFGQKRTVHVWIVTADTEGAVVENIRRKERDANAMYTEMVKYMNGENRIAVTGNAPKRSVYAPQQNIQMPTFLKGAAAI